MANEGRWTDNGQPLTAAEGRTVLPILEQVEQAIVTRLLPSQAALDRAQVASENPTSADAGDRAEVKDEEKEEQVGDASYMPIYLCYVAPYLYIFPNIYNIYVHTFSIYRFLACWFVVFHVLCGYLIRLPIIVRVSYCMKSEESIILNLCWKLEWRNVMAFVDLCGLRGPLCYPQNYDKSLAPCV